MTVVINGTSGVTFSDASTQATSATGFGFKNRIINGAMMIDQRNAGAAVTNGSGTTYYVDRWLTYDGSGGSHFSVQQNKGGVTPPAGFKKYLGLSTSSAVSASAGNNFTLNQYIEGLNVSDFAWGSASASAVTLSFWVYSSLTGTFAGVLQEDSGTAFYVYTYTISSANTWTQITINVPGPTIGTWDTTNGRGINMRWDLGMGSNFNTASPNAWSASSGYSVSGAQKIVGTSGATFYITGVQLEKGSTATSFDYRPYGTELALCQRYYEKSYNIDVVPGTATGAGAVDVTVTSNGSSLATYQVKFAVTKRSTPSLTGYRTTGTSGQWTYERSGVGATAQTVNFGGTSTDTAYASVNVGAGWVACEIYGAWVASAEL